MGAFNTKEVLFGSPSLIPTIAKCIRDEFQKDGYQVSMDALTSGGYDISITKGNMFKAVLGMKTALKITLLPQGESINFNAGIGIFGKMIVPTLLMWYVAWPVLITQIWGLVEQSKIDDRALNIAKGVVAGGSPVAAAHDSKRFCTACGKENSATARFCSACGNPLQ